MKQSRTDRLLTLGMALYTDKRAMERRVRGIFARKRSTKATVLIALLLVCALAFGGFTTACQPGQTTATNGNAAPASAGNALASGGNALASGGNAVDVDADAQSNAGQGTTREQVMQYRDYEFEENGAFAAPRIGNTVFTERGTWTVQKNADKAAALEAQNSFLKIANAVFYTDYTVDDVTATYYKDETGFRADLWHIAANDGTLVGAVKAGTYDFISAQCKTEVPDALHSSIADGVFRNEQTGDSNLDSSAAETRIAGILGEGVVQSKDALLSYFNNTPYAWAMQEQISFQLESGRWCAVNLYGDAALTPFSIGIFPDEDCLFETEYWRADLDMSESAVQLQHPQDFRKGEPGADDMSVEDAYAFFYRLIELAGDAFGGTEKVQEPNATFYIDYSGARENYWHLEGDNLSFDLTSKTGRMLNLKANNTIGFDIGLLDIPYAEMGNQAYLDATKKLFNGLFGEGSVKEVQLNAVYDYHYCTVDPVMADGTSYEIMYCDGLVEEVTALLPISRGFQRADAQRIGWARDRPQYGILM